MTGESDTEFLKLSSARVVGISSTAVSDKSFRLDASAFLAANPFAAPTLLRDSTQVLSDLADVFTVYIQTPILYYVEPFALSRPYLTTSELGEYQCGVPTHVSLITDPRLSEWELAKNTIVLSRSGRVGEAYWVDKKLAGALVGDSFRIVPKIPEDAYYLYALLASPYARNYVTGVTYGSVVDHASVDQVRSLPLPNLTPSVRTRISDLVRRSVLAREAAYDLIDEAESQMLNANSLKPIKYEKTSTFEPLGEPECFRVDFRKVQGTSGDKSESRLDAHFYNVLAQQATKNITNCTSEIKRVGDVAQVSFVGGRLKRNYVQSDHGVPFLSGKNIIQIRPPDLKYLSNLQMSNLEELFLKRSQTLISRSGTVGRTCFVWRNYEDYAGSEHILRVTPDSSLVDPGYLNAFLSSRYGYEQILRFRHGSVIDEITETQIEQILLPCPPCKQQEAIGDRVRAAYDKRLEALQFEDSALTLVMGEIKANSVIGER